MHVSSGDPQGSQRGGRLSYKFERLRERIRQAIESGQLAGKLPGERELARQFHANAKTISKALSDLATEGLLVRHVGRGTFVARRGGAAPAVTSARRLALLTAEGRPRNETQPIVNAVTKMAQQGGHTVTPVEVPLDADGAVAAGAVSLGRLREFDGLAFCAIRPGYEWLADLLRRHAVFTLIAAQDDAARTNAVLPDYASGAFALSEHLIALGHRDVALIVESSSDSLLGLAQTGYVSSMRRHGLIPRPVIVGDETTAVSTFFEQGEPAPSAVCLGVRVADALAREAQRRDRRVPDRFSLAVMPELGAAVPVESGWTTYEIDLHKVGRWVVEQLTRATPGQLPQTVVVPGRLATRTSTAPPAAPASPTTPMDAVI